MTSSRTAISLLVCSQVFRFPSRNQVFELKWKT
jgi:hypothetical protein